MEHTHTFIVDAWEINYSHKVHLVRLFVLRLHTSINWREDELCLFLVGDLQSPYPQKPQSCHPKLLWRPPGTIILCLFFFCLREPWEIQDSQVIPIQIWLHISPNLNSSLQLPQLLKPFHCACWRAHNQGIRGIPTF